MEKAADPAAYAPYRWTGLPRYERNPWPAQMMGKQRASCQAQDDLDDAVGGPSTFIHSADQMHAISAMGGRDRVRWPTFSRRRAW